MLFSIDWRPDLFRGFRSAVTVGRSSQANTMMPGGVAVGTVFSGPLDSTWKVKRIKKGIVKMSAIKGHEGILEITMPKRCADIFYQQAQKQ